MKPLLKFLRSAKARYLLLALAIVIGGWVFLKGCVHNKMLNHPRYNVAVDRSWYPLVLYGKENNLLAFTDEFFEAISQDTGLRFNLLEVRTPNLMRDLDSGVYDAVVSSLPPTRTNELKYHFSNPFYLLGPVLLARSDSAIKSLDELHGRYVGVRRGMSLNFDSPLPNASIVPYDNMTLAFADLEDNKIDAVIMDSIQAYVQIQGIYAGKIKIVTKPLTKEGLRLITLNNPRYDELFEIFNKSVTNLIESGKYDELLIRWGLFNPYSHQL